MVQRIKNFLFVFSTILLGILYPFISSAGWVDNLRKGIGTYILFLIIKLAVNIAKFFTGLSGSLLNWALSPNFISYSYTNPGGPKPNPIIETGLGVTQGFVNMLLVLILVYIAIATILRLAGYETKKLLITFIIVALLVNFAPVICGLIVDASNIVMNFFVQDLKADAFGATMARSVEEISAGFDERTEVESAWPFITQLAVMIPFLWVLTFILLLFTVIFILRYLVIWLLVILSPLAFACYILPITRKYFDKWWEQFTNWSFIGVSCGFFLYLGLLLVTKIQAGAAVSIPSTAGNAVFNGILPYFVSAIFLGIGFVFGLQTSAIGASTVVNFAKARGRGTLRGAAKGAGWVAGKIAQRGIRPALEKARAKEAVGYLARGVEKLPVARWFMPEKARLYGQMRPAIEKAKTQAKAYSSQTLGHRILKGADTQTDALGNLIEILERGDGQDIFKEAKKLRKWKDMSDQELLQDDAFIKKLARPLDLALKGGLLTSAVLRRDPRLAAIATAAKIGPYKKKPTSAKEAISEAVGQARAQHISSWEPEVFENTDVIEACLGKFDRERWLQVNRTVKNGQAEALKGIDKAFKAFLDGSKHKGEKDPKKLEIIFKGDFREHIKEQTGGEGYFKALDDKRIEQTGWRTGQLPKSQAPTVGEVTLRETEKLRSIGEKARQTQPLKSISEKRKEEQKLKSIIEKRKRKEEK